MYAPNGLEALGLILVVCVGATLARMAMSVHPPAAARESARSGPSGPRLVIHGEGAIRASDEAGRLLGVDAAEILDSRGFVSALAGGGDAATAAFRRLAAEGEAFRLTVQTRAGRMIELLGRPEGLAAIVSMHDATALWRRAEAAERRAAEAESRLAEWRAAASAAGLSALRIGDDAAAWREGGAAPAEAARPALEAAAAELAGPGAPRRRRVEPEAGGEAFDLVAAAPGLFAVLDAGPAVAAERTLRRFVGTVSETLAQLETGLAICDADLRLSLFNPAFAELVGAEPAQLARRPALREVLEGMRRARALPEQADFAGWRAALLARVEAGERFEESWHLDGGRTLRARVRPHASGGLAIVLENVTEAVRLRRSHAAEQAARRATTELLEEGVAVIGPDGRLVMSNGAFGELWRLDRPPEAGERFDALAARLGARAAEAAPWGEFAAALAGGAERRQAAASVALGDGRALALRASPMPDGSTLLVAADATAREKMEEALGLRAEALEQAEELRRALVDQISHRMRAPLTSIAGFGQLLAGGQAGPLNAVQRDYVAGLVESARDLLDSVDAMSDLVALGAEPGSPGAPADPAPALREAAEMLRRRAAGRPIELDLAAAPCLAYSGRVRLRRALYNLGLDALAKAPPGAPIRLAARAVEADLMLCVRHEASGGEEPAPGPALALVRRFAREEGGEVVATRDGAARRVACRFVGAVAAEATPRRRA